MEQRPFEDMRDEGLLWLINRVVFHPRGYALAFHLDDDGVATGWSLMGDGSESWSMGPIPEGHPTEDDLFHSVSELLTHRANPQVQREV
jgi:hypothetical protein